MSWPQQYLKFRPTRGCASDAPPWEVAPDYWTRVSNVLFREAFAERFGGERSAYATVQTNVLNLLNAVIGGVNYWIYHGTNKSYVVQTSTHTDVTLAAGLTNQTLAHRWSSGLLNGLPFMNNGVDRPQYWDGNIANKFVVLPTWPVGETCGQMVAHRNFLFALAIENGSGSFPMLLKWSDAAVAGAIPATWTPAAGNYAGSASLSDTPGPLLTAATLRDSMMIYKRSSTYAGQYVDDPNQVFSFRGVFSTTGALTRRAVCDLGDGRHLVVTDGDIVITDGVSRRSIAKGRMAQFVFSQIDSTNYEQLFVAFNRTRNEAWVCFPEPAQTQCTLAAVYNLDSDTFGVVTLSSASCAAVGVVNDVAVDDSWSGDAQAWDLDTSSWNQANYSLATEHLLFGIPGTPRLTQTDTQDATTRAAIVSRYDLDFGDAKRLKKIKSLQVLADTGYGTLYVRVGYRATTTASVTWEAERTLTEPQSLVNSDAQGRFISFEIRSAASNVWTVTGVNIAYELRGYH
jgi:hypothetical protein